MQARPSRSAPVLADECDAFTTGVAGLQLLAVPPPFSQ